MGSGTVLAAYPPVRDPTVDCHHRAPGDQRPHRPEVAAADGGPDRDEHDVDHDVSHRVQLKRHLEGTRSVRLDFAAPRAFDCHGHGVCHDACVDLQASVAMDGVAPERVFVEVANLSTYPDWLGIVLDAE